MEFEKSTGTYYVTNVGDFVKLMENIMKSSDKFYFRGQSKNYPTGIIPSVLRTQEFFYNENELYDNALLNDPDLFKDAKNNFDRMTLMQHHQFPTRLLDITENPLVALYFAVESNQSSDGEIFIYHNKLNKEKTEKLLFAGKKEKYFENLDLDITNTFGDTIEADLTLSRLSSSTRKNVIDSVYKFNNQLNNRNISWENWKEFYGEFYNQVSHFRKMTK